MSAEIVDIAGYRVARQLASLATMDDEYGQIIEGMAEVYRRKARTILSDDGGEALASLATPLPQPVLADRLGKV
jgi:hypothetical protein